MARNLRWRAAFALLLGAFTGVVAGVTHAQTLTWTCPCKGDVIHFAPGDGAYMERMAALHVERHCGGGTSMGPVGTDPVFGVLRPVLMQGAEQLGEAFAREIFGFRDPIEEQQLAELRRLEQERLAELEHQRQEELARRRRELHQRLMSDLVLLGSDAELPLMGLDGTSAAPSPASQSLPLLDLDDTLRPAGTSFFGTGGGGPAPVLRSHVVDLRDLRRAAYLVERATSATSEDRGLLIDEAVRAVEGDTSLVADAPPHFALADGESKLAALRARQAHVEGTARERAAAESRHSQAQWVRRATEQATQRAEAELGRLQATRADPEAIARQRELLQELRAAARRAGETLEESRREVDLAREIHEWTRWGRREQVATLGGSGWAPLSDSQQQSRTKLERIYRKKIDVPPPEIPGSIVRAENGRRALARLTELEASLPTLPAEEQAQARDILTEARHRAQLMDYYDRVINAHTRERVESMRELAQKPAAAQHEVRGLALAAVDSLDGALAVFREADLPALRNEGLRDVRLILALEETARDADGVREDLAVLRAGMLSGSLSFSEQVKLSDRVTGLAASLAKKVQELDGAPSTAIQSLERRAYWIKTAHSVSRATQHTLEIIDLHEQAIVLDDRLGDQARQIRQVQEQYERQVDGFQRERRALEEMQARHAALVPASTSDRN